MSRVNLALFIIACALAMACARQEESYAESGAMVIIEPRPHELLKTVIDEFDKRVPEDWTLYVFHGTRNKSHAETACEAVRAHRQTKVIDLGVDNLDADSYNALLQSPKFWDQVDAEHVLVFQTDSVPCGSTLDLDRFGKFGYIGCAYPQHAVGKVPGVWDGHSFYGSGGLSLRRKSFMTRCMDMSPPGQPEDVAFSDCVDALDLPKPTADDLADFCAQNSFGKGYPRSWGAHQIGRQMPDHLKKRFFSHCPLARLI